jgi:hypothetical protein
MKNKVYILKEYKKEIDLTEIDLEFKEKFTDKKLDDLDDWPEIIFKQGKGSWEGEGEPLEIDMLMKHLEKLKSLGCNYVEVMNHTDHNGYYLNGIAARRANPEDVSEYEENRREQKRKLIEKQLHLLKEQQAKLQSELKKK